MLTNKDYCDYDTSITLGELGFPLKRMKVKNFIDGQFSDSIVTVLLYEAQKWLRKERGINIFVMQIIIEGSGMRRYASYIQLGDKIWLCRYYSLYEEALLEGIKETVKILKNGIGE